MDQMVATVRVRPDIGGSERPTRGRVEEAAECLRRRGFSVLHIGRFGVSVRADRPVFERELGVRAEPFKALVAKVFTSEPKLARLVDSVEFAPPAEHFS